MTEELHRVIPIAHADPLQAVHDKLDRVLVVLEGRHDENGEHHPGLSHRVTRLENALNWSIGIATTAIGAILATWTGIIGGKHP